MSSVIIAGNTSGTITLDAPNVAGTTTLTLPTTSGTIALTASPTFTGQATIPTINLTGGQITFPATAVPSADANTLDDYEEGTWTPNKGSGITNTGTFTSSGTYIKIGRMVYVNFQMNATALACSASGQITTNLPFSMPGNAMGVSANSGNYMSLAYGFSTEIYCGTAALPAPGGAGAIFVTITYPV